MARALGPAFDAQFKAIVLRELRDEIAAGNLVHQAARPFSEVRRTPPPPWDLVAAEPGARRRG